MLFLNSLPLCCICWVFVTIPLSMCVCVQSCICYVLCVWEFVGIPFCCVMREKEWSPFSQNRFLFSFCYWSSAWQQFFSFLPLLQMGRRGLVGFESPNGPRELGFDRSNELRMSRARIISWVRICFDFGVSTLTKYEKIPPLFEIHFQIESISFNIPMVSYSHSTFVSGLVRRITFSNSNRTLYDSFYSPYSSSNALLLTSQTLLHEIS